MNALKDAARVIPGFPQYAVTPTGEMYVLCDGKWSRHIEWKANGIGPLVTEIEGHPCWVEPLVGMAFQIPEKAVQRIGE